MSLLKSLVVFMAVFILSLVSAQNDLELSPQSDLEATDEIQELLRNVLTLYEMKVANKVQQGSVPEEENDENDVGGNPNGCNCGGLKCSCCKFIRVSKLNLKDNCCLSVTYLPRNYGILIVLKFGAKTLFSKEISARNPPPVCVGIPYLKRGGSICIQFYNLNIAAKSFSGCGRLLARLLFVTVAKVDVGCFRMNFINTTQQVDAVELPYLDGPQTPVEGPEPLYLGEVTMEEIKPSYKKKI